jgi:hypothetical protein
VLRSKKKDVVKETKKDKSKIKAFTEFTVENKPGSSYSLRSSPHFADDFCAFS